MGSVLKDKYLTCLWHLCVSVLSLHVLPALSGISLCSLVSYCSPKTCNKVIFFASELPKLSTAGHIQTRIQFCIPACACGFVNCFVLLWLTLIFVGFIKLDFVRDK